MRPFEWYNLNVYHVMEVGENRVLVEIHKNKFFCALSLNISYKIHFFFGEKNLVTLDTYVKKINPPSIVLGGGGAQ